MVWKRPLFPPSASSTDVNGSGHGQALLLQMQDADRSCHRRPSATILDGTPAFGTGSLARAHPMHCPLGGTPPDNSRKPFTCPDPPLDWGQRPSEPEGTRGSLGPPALGSELVADHVWPHALTSASSFLPLTWSCFREKKRKHPPPKLPVWCKVGA